MIVWMTEKEKSGWGGKRDNQHGRPKLPAEVRRISIHARIAPDTHAYLSKDKEGLGRAIDKLYNKKKKT